MSHIPSIDELERRLFLERRCPTEGANSRSAQPVQRSDTALVVDGTPAADEKIARVLWDDPATGVIRHTDAGYQLALESAKQSDLWPDARGFTLNNGRS